MNGPHVRIVGKWAEATIRAFGTDVLPVVDLSVRSVRSQDDQTDCLMLDLARVSMMDLCGLADEMAKAQPGSRGEIFKQIRERGVPLRLEWCMVIDSERAQNPEHEERGGAPCSD